MQPARNRQIDELKREEGSGVRRRPRPPQPPTLTASELSDETSLSKLVASVAPPPADAVCELFLEPTMPPPTIDPLISDVGDPDEEGPLLVPMRFSLAPRRAVRKSRRLPFAARIAAGVGAVALGIGVAAFTVPAPDQVAAPPLTHRAPAAQPAPRGPTLELQDVSADFDPSTLLATVGPAVEVTAAPPRQTAEPRTTAVLAPSAAPALATEMPEAASPEALVAEPAPVEEVAPPPIAAPAAVVEAPPTRQRDGTLLDLVDRALGHGAQPEPAPAPVVAAPSAPEPSTPTREEVRATMEGTRGAIEACAAGEHGSAQLELQVASSGRVRSALVTGDFAGTPAGSCMARAARGATFPAFEAERFAVRYPFRF